MPESRSRGSITKTLQGSHASKPKDLGMTLLDCVPEMRVKEKLPTCLECSFTDLREGGEGLAINWEIDVKQVQ